MTASIIIYKTPQVRTLILGGISGEKLMNFPINRTDFILYKGITNEILFFVKDVDNKPVSTGAGTAAIVIKDEKTILLQQDLEVIDNTTGLYKLTIAPADIDLWDIGYVKFSIIFTRLDGTTVMLYTDKGYSIESQISVLKGPYPPQQEAVEVTQFTPMSGYMTSAAFDASLSIDNPTGIYNIVFYCNSYGGGVVTEGSLALQPMEDNDWFMANTVSYGEVYPLDAANNVTVSGAQNISVTGNFNWIRFKVVSNATVAAVGSIDKITFLC